MKENEESLFWFLERNKNIEIVSMFWINKDECKIVYDEVKKEIEKECNPFYMGFDKTELDKIHKFIMENGVKVIDITQESKYTPTHDELLKMGFEETTWRGYYANKDKTILYSFLGLFKYESANDKEIPFHTKEEFIKAVGYEKQEWKPSEELLTELGFGHKGFSFDKERFWLFEKMPEHSICYDSKTNEFNLQEGNIFIHSDSELRMLVEILGREK